MKTTDKNESWGNDQTITNRCLQSCGELLAGIERVRNRIANEFHETLEANGQLVQLALNEAEALAWQTAYPHLLFPSLAMEKIQAVTAWQTRQQFMLQPHLAFAEAA